MLLTFGSSGMTVMIPKVLYNRVVGLGVYKAHACHKSLRV